MMMNKIALGQTTLRVSRLGISVGTVTSERETLKTLRAAVDCGIDLFDTAPSHGTAGFGYTEILLGGLFGKKAPWPYRDAKVATKFSLGHHETGSQESIVTAIMRMADESLRRLRRDTIDLYQLTELDPALPIDAILDGLLQLRKSGKIRHFGAVQLTVMQLKEAETYGGFEILQIANYNDYAAHSLLPWCRNRNLGVLVCDAPMEILQQLGVHLVLRDIRHHWQLRQLTSESLLTARQQRSPRRGRAPISNRPRLMFHQPDSIS